VEKPPSRFRRNCSTVLRFRWKVSLNVLVSELECADAQKPSLQAELEVLPFQDAMRKLEGDDTLAGVAGCRSLGKQ